jgi:hypothetical protein
MAQKIGDKVKMARSMMSREEMKNGTSIFGSKKWTDRQEFIKTRVNKQIQNARTKKLNREKAKEAI